MLGLVAGLRKATAFDAHYEAGLGGRPLQKGTAADAHDAGRGG